MGLHTVEDLTFWSFDAVQELQGQFLPCLKGSLEDSWFSVGNAKQVCGQSDGVGVFTLSSYWTECEWDQCPKARRHQCLQAKRWTKTFSCLKSDALMKLGDVWRLWVEDDIDHGSASVA